MSGSVTPARRPREDDESEAGSFESSVDGEGTPRSNVAKRARLDNNDSEGDGSPESFRGDLLPDTFRRSPKVRGRGVNMLANRQKQQTHPPGSIVRVTLTNFVTYSSAEFHPGPTLNMIIGPNGTGKSTLVCAICLGLGMNPVHLGRAKELGEFVKHGAKHAVIEIELAKDPQRFSENIVIKTKITREGNKAAYHVNEESKSKARVVDLVRSLSIQIDNLCQFLPQDRVSEFAGLSPERLLVETLRAAAPEYMSEWHEQLKSMRKEQRSHQEEQQRQLEAQKQDENRQRLQEADVVRLRERSELETRRNALEKFRPFPEYALAKAQHNEAKRRFKQASKEVAQLQQRQQPYREAVDNKQHYLERVTKAVGTRERHVQRQEQVVMENKGKITNAEAKMKGCENEIETEKRSRATSSKTIPALQQEIRNLQNAMRNPPEPFDAAEMNEQMRACSRRLREMTDRAADIKREVRARDVEIEQRAQVINQANSEKGNLQSQAGKQENKLRDASRDAATAWKWIQQHRDEFESPIYGPPIIECSLKDQKYANIVESVMQDSEKLAFTVTSSNDFNKLNHQLSTTMKLNQINVRNSPNPLASFTPPVPKDQLRNYGFRSYVLELLDGPEPVLAMLCDNARLHLTAFSDRDITDEEFERMKDTPLTSVVTPSSTYSIVRRREYGEQAMSTRVNSVRPARYLTDSPVDHQHDDELNRRIREAEGEMAEIRAARQTLSAEGNQLKVDWNQETEKKMKIERDKGKRQTAKSAFDSLPLKKQRAEQKLADALEIVNSSKDRVRGYEQELDQVTVTKGQLVLDFANSVEALRLQHVHLFEAQILQIEAESDLEQLRARHAEEERSLRELQADCKRLEREVEDRLKEGRRLQAVCSQCMETLNDAEVEVYQEVVTEHKWSQEQFDTEVESLGARIEMTAGGGNANTLKEFEARAIKMQTRRAKLQDLEEQLKELFSKIEDLKGRWEPQLDELIGQISDAFAENFAGIQCAGEVGIYKDEEDFERWAIQVKVKFREHEQLSILDSHRQSGGERAVSTIFFLMALQSLARAPFRVVDEINQGMDPRNERLVHSRMVDIACAEHTSQYFLMTPKLLSGLKYHPNMKVHCIASGEYMPDDYRKLDFAALAEKALAARGRGGDVEVAV